MLKCTQCDHDLETPALTCDMLTCAGCGFVYSKLSSGVWDFRQENNGGKDLAVYEEAEYKRWREIFGTIEIRNWKIYANRLNRFFSQAGHRVIGKFYRDNLKEDELVVEIGAGAGALLEFADIPNYVGIDTNLDALEQFASLHPQAILLCTSGGRLPIASGCVDRVISLHTLEHIYSIAEFFEDVTRILKKDGHHDFVFPCEGGWPFALGRKMITGPHLRKKYDLDVEYVMQREHINDANRVKKFLRLYFKNVQFHHWPLRFLPLLGANVTIWGTCQKRPELDG